MTGLTGLRVLVTGGAGFVGANLLRELLAREADVHAVVRARTDTWRIDALRPRLRLHDADITDAARIAAIVRAIDPHVVFHMAKHRGNPSTLDYRAAYDANVAATLNLLEPCVGAPSLVRFVHAGSSLEYDLRRSPLRESDALAPQTIHGVTKAAATLLCQQFAQQHGVPAVVLRLFTVYGPWEGAARFVPSLMRAALTNRPIALTRAGLTHDWIHVDDVVEACLRAVSAEGIEGEVLNVATGVTHTNEDLVEAVEALTRCPIAREVEPFPARPWDTDVWVADVTKSAARLGWRASTTLGDGLRRTLAWFAAQPEQWSGGGGRA